MSELRDEYVAALEVENAELREKIRSLEVLHGISFAAPTVLALTGTEEKMLGFLAGRERATKEQLMQALYGDRVDNPPELKIIDVFVCKIRKKIKPFGMEIDTHWGKGYSLPPASKAILKKFTNPEPVNVREPATA